MPARDALGAGEMTGGELFAAAYVDDGHALVDQLVDLGGVDLLDPALDLAEKLSSGGGTHRETPKPRSGFTDFTKYSRPRAPPGCHARAVRTVARPPPRSCLRLGVGCQREDPSRARAPRSGAPAPAQRSSQRWR